MKQTGALKPTIDRGRTGVGDSGKVMQRIAGFLLAVTASLPLRAGPEMSLAIGHGVRDRGCALIAGPATFRGEEAAVFVRVSTLGIPSRVTVEWINPSFESAGQSSWTAVPEAACLITQMPLAGYPAGRTPGDWTVRATIDGTVVERRFRVSSAASPTTIASAAVRAAGHNRYLDLTGTGFEPGSVVHIARFSESGGWQYLAATLPDHQSHGGITVVLPELAPGEYIAVIRAGDGTVSSPARFVLTSPGAYQMPVPAGETWVISQGPHGAFSHWNRSEHAWDIAPQHGRYVTAMRAGTAHTHDLGLGQTPGVRSFGNYITIDHGDGEFSHYAHLATGRLLVRDGQYVEQGQRIAVVGNSGYTLGPGGGYHVHVHVTRSPAIYAQSIPFRFNESRSAETQVVAKSGESADLNGRSASVQVSQWWSELATVPVGTSEWRVSVALETAGYDVDLHLVSPSGRHYGWYGDQTGYSGRDRQREEFRLTDPDPGTWRIAVQGISGSSTIGFRVTTEFKGRTSPSRSKRVVGGDVRGKMKKPRDVSGLSTN